MSTKEDMATGHLTHVIQVSYRRRIRVAAGAADHFFCMRDRYAWSLSSNSVCIDIARPVWPCRHGLGIRDTFFTPMTHARASTFLPQVAKATEEQRLDQHRMLLGVNYKGVIVSVNPGQPAGQLS